MNDDAKILAAKRKYQTEKEQGIHFSGKSSLESLDLLDFQKREICMKLVRIYKENGQNEEAMVALVRATSIAEMRAALKFRTERLTLERLIEMYSSATKNDDLLNTVRSSLLGSIRIHQGLSKIKLNEGVRSYIFGNNPDMLHLDFLVGLVEKLELISPSGSSTVLLIA